MGYIFDNVNIAGDATANLSGTSDIQGNMYNVGGHAVPEYPNFSTGGMSAKVSVGSTTTYAAAGALALIGIVFLGLKKRGKG